MRSGRTTRLMTSRPRSSAPRRQSQTGPRGRRVSITSGSSAGSVRSNCTRGVPATGHCFTTRRLEPVTSHPFGSHVSPVPAILQRVLRSSRWSSGSDRATSAKLGISNTTDQVVPAERRNISVGRRRKDTRPEVPSPASRRDPAAATVRAAPFMRSATRSRVSFSHSRLLWTSSRSATRRLSVGG